MNEVSRSTSECLDVSSINMSKCYDELMYSETHNDIYDTKINDDKFALLAKLDEEAFVKVKTPIGMSPEFVLQRSIFQGSVLGPIKCSVSIDTFGGDTLSAKNSENVLYKYKNVIDIPPLAMMDDSLAISKCGIKSIAPNSMLNSMIEGEN